MTLKYVSALSLMAAVTVSLPTAAFAGCATFRPTCSTQSYPTVSRHYSAPVIRSRHNSYWTGIQPIHRSFETAPCPPNTSQQPDGTCLLRGYSSGHYGSSLTYGSSYGYSYPSHSYGSSIYSGPSFSSSLYSQTEYLPCPPGTVQQADRSCLVAGGVLRTPGYGSQYSPPYEGTYSWTGYEQAAPIATPSYVQPVPRSAPEVVIYTGGASAGYQPIASPYGTYP